MFLEFVSKKEAVKFNADLAEAATGYCDLLQVGLKEDQQIFKVVINPEANKAICVVAGLAGDEKSGPYGLLKFLENRPYVLKTKKVVLIPCANPVGFEHNTKENACQMDLNRHFLFELKEECHTIWNIVTHENVDLLVVFEEAPNFEINYNGNTNLIEDILDVLGEFNVEVTKNPSPNGSLEHKCSVELAIPYITIKVPDNLNKSYSLIKDIMSKIVSQF